MDSDVNTPPRKHGRFLPRFSYSPSTQIDYGEHLSPATEFKPGEHASPATEFKPGQPAHNKLPIGSVSIRVETNTGLPRAWVKTAEPNIWRKRAVANWESVNGPLLKGYVVHHRDGDSLNDDIDNLLGMTRSDHAAEHRELKSYSIIELKLKQSAHNKCNKLPIGTISIRVEPDTGLPRAWIKVAQPNTWRKRAIVNWESVNGPLPKGYVVHHRDGASLNDDIDNLLGMTRSDHTAKHRGKLGYPEKRVDQKANLG